MLFARNFQLFTVLSAASRNIGLPETVWARMTAPLPSSTNQIFTVPATRALLAPSGYMGNSEEIGLGKIAFEATSAAVAPRTSKIVMTASLERFTSKLLPAFGSVSPSAGGPG